MRLLHFQVFYLPQPNLSLSLYDQLFMITAPRGRDMICIVSTLVGLSFIAVILRAFARLKRKTGLGVDDFLSFICILLLIAMLIELVLWVTVSGNGAHMHTLSEENLIHFFKVMEKV